jgi:hypothetical protein
VARLKSARQRLNCHVASKRGQKRRGTNKRGPGAKGARGGASADRRNDLTGSGMTMTMEIGDISLMSTLTEAQENPDEETVAVTSIPVEDTIHPYALNFPPPLQELASRETKGFQRHWEKLTYAFDLPDPADFPALPLTDDDQQLLSRFVQQCEYLASYSLISDDQGSLKIWSEGQSNWQIAADLPGREIFGGTAVAFRQIHNHGEEASFSKVKGRLYKATGQLEQHQQAELRATMSRWVDARGELMNHLLPTVVCQKVSEAPPGHPVSFRDINPEDLFQMFNYGDTIHWGEHREKLVNLLADPSHEAYYRYALIVAILGLSHLYFGWSVLVKAAVGDRSV